MPSPPPLAVPAQGVEAGDRVHVDPDWNDVDDDLAGTFSWSEDDDLTGTFGWRNVDDDH